MKLVKEHSIYFFIAIIIVCVYYAFKYFLITATMNQINESTYENLDEILKNIFSNKYYKYTKYYSDTIFLLGTESTWFYDNKEVKINEIIQKIGTKSNLKSVQVLFESTYNVNLDDFIKAKIFKVNQGIDGNIQYFQFLKKVNDLKN